MVPSAEALSDFCFDQLPELPALAVCVCTVVRRHGAGPIIDQPVAKQTQTKMDFPIYYLHMCWRGVVGG